jgi:hypothetical protein
MGAIVRRLLKLGLALASAAALASTGCGDDSGADGWVAATGEEFAVAWGRAVCERRVRSCCERDGVAYDERACAEAHSNHARREIERKAGLGGALNLRYASLCVRQIEASAPDCGLDLTIGPLPPGLDARRSYCGLLFDPPHGAAAPGESCVAPSDCAASGAGHVGCVQRGHSPATTCQLVAPGREGDLCDDRERRERGEPATPVLYHCETAGGIYCNRDTRRCARREPPRAPCHSDHDCADGGYCAGCDDDESCEAGGICTAFRGVDEACDRAANLFCERSLHCDEASGRCVPRQRAGEPCGDDSSCWGYCVGGVCDGGLTSPRAKACNGAETQPYWTGSHR